MKTKCYRILDVNLSLSSDSEIFLRNFETDFSLFAAAEEAETRGLGVVSLNGKMIDGPIIDHARKVVALSASGIRD